MHRYAMLAMLATATLAPVAGWAQSTPSTEQIIKSLKPTAISGATRGIRLGGAASSTPNVQSPPPAAAPSVSLSVQFATGSAELTPQATQVLDNLGKALNDKSLATFRFRIEGHTDTVGSRDYNKDLSDRRAAAVVDYLVNNFHVDRNRVQAVGLGKDELLVPTPDQTPEPRNRRVHVVNLGT